MNTDCEILAIPYAIGLVLQLWIISLKFEVKPYEHKVLVNKSMNQRNELMVVSPRTNLRIRGTN